MAQGKSTFGLDKNVAAAATYLFMWVSGLVFLLVEKHDKDIIFHAWQSILFFGVLFILIMIPIINLLAPIILLAALIGWIVLLVKTYQGEKIKLPVIGDFAEKQAGK